MDGCRACADDARFLRTRKRPNYEARTPRLRIVDLFAGGGGLSLGFAEAARRVGWGIKIAAAVEIDEDAADVYDLNFPGAVIDRRDVAKIFHGRLGTIASPREEEFRDETGIVDVLLAGPPCQGHSDLNNVSRRMDPRNRLYLRVVRAAEVLRPKWLLVENVPMVRHDAGKVVPLAIKALEQAGYQVVTTVIHLTDLGVPQLRRRHILLATRDRRAHPAMILRTNIACTRHDPRTVAWAIDDLEGVSAPSGPDCPSRVTAPNVARIRWLFDKDRYNLPNHLRPMCHRDDHSYVAMYGRLAWDLPAQTITTGFGSMGQGRYVHPSRQRTLTPHEAARLQTFPDFFDLGADKKRSTWAHVIGNAVPPLLGVHLGLALLRASRPKATLSSPTRSRQTPMSWSAPAPMNEIIRQRMRTTRRRDTKPELVLQKVLSELGLTYLVDHRIAGNGRRRADVVFLDQMVAVYVNGCYWHACPEHGTTPKNNRDWWKAKFEENRRRDAESDATLRQLGWKVMRFWEHDDLAVAALRVAEAVKKSRPTAVV